MQALKLYYDSEESKEDVRAFNERRKPEFRKYVKCRATSAIADVASAIQPQFPLASRAQCKTRSRSE